MSRRYRLLLEAALEDKECICTRDTGIVVCGNCGHVFRGRLIKKCTLHRNVRYLMDHDVCAKCTGSENLSERPLKMGNVNCQAHTEPEANKVDGKLQKTSAKKNTRMWPPPDTPDVLRRPHSLGTVVAAEHTSQRRNPLEVDWVKEMCRPVARDSLKRSGKRSIGCSNVYDREDPRSSGRYPSNFFKTKEETGGEAVHFSRGRAVYELLNKKQAEAKEAEEAAGNVDNQEPGAASSSVPLTMQSQSMEETGAGAVHFSRGRAMWEFITKTAEEEKRKKKEAEEKKKMEEEQKKKKEERKSGDILPEGGHRRFRRMLNFDD